LEKTGRLEEARKWEELRLLYTIVAHDLDRLKHQQWSITNYALSVFAGIAAVSRLLGGYLHCPLVGVSLGVCVAAAAASAWVLQDNLHTELQRSRARMNRTRLEFSSAFRTALGDVPHGYQNRTYGLLLAKMFKSVIVLGALLGLAVVIAGSIPASATAVQCDVP